MFSVAGLRNSDCVALGAKKNTLDLRLKYVSREQVGRPMAARSVVDAGAGPAGPPKRAHGTRARGEEKTRWPRGGAPKRAKASKNNTSFFVPLIPQLKLLGSVKIPSNNKKNSRMNWICHSTYCRILTEMFQKPMVSPCI